MLKMLHRPRLLIRAARCGVDDYNRSRHLPRLLHEVSVPGPGQAIMRLMATEKLLNEKRLNDDASYSIMQHVEVLIAMMGEARLLSEKTPPATAIKTAEL
jgi:hypothetical protein